jgi:hypothetical protein
LIEIAKEADLEMEQIHISDKTFWPSNRSHGQTDLISNKSDRLQLKESISLEKLLR